MNRVLRISAFFIALTLLVSCNFEKRLYRSGYYVCSPKTVKNSSLPKDAVTLSAEHKRQSTPDAASDEDLTLSLSPSISNEGGTKHPVDAKKYIPTIKNDLQVHNDEQRVLIQPAQDDDPVKKDVKLLFAGSVSAFLLAFLFGLFWSMQAGIASVIFVLLPFSIVGLWIFVLLLYQKYSHEDSYGSPEKKESKEKLYSQHKAFLLAGFLGIFGAHRFYLGYPKMGLLEMCTLGGFFILYFVDMIRIKQGTLKPFDGIYVRGESTYTREEKKTGSSLSLTYIRLAFILSILALMLFLGFAIFL